ncbi:MAG: glycosyltransferase family 2 protein [Candidatus Electrothrix sp. MAN1_4]|nr:glycosyltransferase family 2 protein [Candidatus Electrothrix sp. MAN1_4]
MHTPVLFLVYKRPDTTRQVFEAIRQARPPRLYVAADGPRKDVPGQAEKVQQVRDIVLKGVDWDCEVKTLFREENLGCKYGVSGGIDWFFENEEEGIILEDDTLPSQSFFWFCQELLERYRDDKRIFVISGDNFQEGQDCSMGDSYYFSCFNHCWGWATFKRAWEHFDVDMKQWPEVQKKGCLKYIWSDKSALSYWTNIFQSVYENKVDTWDYYWTFSCWLQNGLTILPNVNLVQNIGFGMDATHTTTSREASKAYQLNFPLIHPEYMMRDMQADNCTQSYHFQKPLLHRITGKIKRYLK